VVSTKSAFPPLQLNRKEKNEQDQMILVDTESYQFATGKKPESYHLPVGRVQYFLFMILAVK